MKQVALVAALVLSAFGAATAQAKEWKTIRIGLEAAYKPFTYKTPDGKLAHVDLNKIRATIVGGSSGFRLANRLESFAIAYAYARDPDLFGQERGRPFHFWMDSGTYGVGLFRIIPRRGASMSFEVVDYSRPNIGDRGAVFWFPK